MPEPTEPKDLSREHSRPVFWRTLWFWVMSLTVLLIAGTLGEFYWLLLGLVPLSTALVHSGRLFLSEGAVMAELPAAPPPAASFLPEVTPQERPLTVERSLSSIPRLVSLPVTERKKMPERTLNLADHAVRFQEAERVLALFARRIPANEVWAFGEWKWNAALDKHVYTEYPLEPYRAHCAEKRALGQLTNAGIIEELLGWAPWTLDFQGLDLEHTPVLRECRQQLTKNWVRWFHPDKWQNGTPEQIQLLSGETIHRDTLLDTYQKTWDVIHEMVNTIENVLNAHEIERKSIEELAAMQAERMASEASLEEARAARIASEAERVASKAERVASKAERVASKAERIAAEAEDVAADASLEKTLQSGKQWHKELATYYREKLYEETGQIPTQEEVKEELRVFFQSANTVITEEELDEMTEGQEFGSWFSAVRPQAPARTLPERAAPKSDIGLGSFFSSQPETPSNVSSLLSRAYSFFNSNKLETTKESKSRESFLSFLSFRSRTEPEPQAEPEEKENVSEERPEPPLTSLALVVRSQQEPSRPAGLPLQYIVNPELSLHQWRIPNDRRYLTDSVLDPIQYRKLVEDANSQALVVWRDKDQTFDYQSLLFNR